MPSDPVRRGLGQPQRYPFQNLFFIGCVIVSLAVLAVGFASYQSHQAYSAYCQSNTHAAEQGCKAIKPLWEPVLSDPTIFFAFATALFTCGLLAIGTAQAGLFWWQLGLIREGLSDTKQAADAAKDQASLARESLIATNRAWIKVEVWLSGQPLAFDLAGGVGTSVHLRISNFGNEPALNVRPKVWLLAPGPKTGVEVIEIVTARCEAVRSQPGAFHLSLFPGEHFPDRADPIWTHGVSIDRAEAEAASTTQGDNTFLFLHVFGCVSYQTPSDTEGHHQTKFLYDLVTSSLKPFVAGQTVPADALGLQRNLFGLSTLAD